MVVHNPLIKSVAVVAVFWWLVLTGWAVSTHSDLFLTAKGIAASVRYSVLALAGLGVGVAMGVALAIWRKLAQRLDRDANLVGQGRLGMLCTLGDMPVQTEQGLQVDGPVPEWFWDKATIPYGPQLKAWVQANQTAHPHHVQALLAIIKVFCQYPDLAASHVPNGHGGKSLVDHSARVAGLALEEARTFKYQGLVTKYGNEPWGDPGYTFDPTDPLIPVVALGHDIGKLITFQVDKNGRVLSSRPHHDSIGSRLLATMEEVKALPAADQSVLHKSISFYHHPSAYPLNFEGRIGDDRAVAIMMLLIKADKRAGKEEAGKSLSSSDYAKYLRYMADLGQEMDSDELAVMKADAESPTGPRSIGARAITDEEMKAALLTVLTNPMLILTSNPAGMDAKAAIGQVNNTNYPQWAWDWKASKQEFDVDAANRLAESIERLVVLNEQKFRQALQKRLGLSTASKLGDGRYTITIHALRVLFQMGLLYTETENGFLSPESALYNAEILRNTDGSVLAAWRSAILLRPVADLDGYAKGPLHPSLVRVARPVWKDRLTRGDSGVSDIGTVEYAEDEVGLAQAPAIEVGADEADRAQAANGGDEYSLAPETESAILEVGEDDQVVVHDDSEERAAAQEPSVLPVLEVVPSFPPLFSPSTKEFLARTAVDLKTPAKAPQEAPGRPATPVQPEVPAAVAEASLEVHADPEVASAGNGEASPKASAPTRPALADEVAKSRADRLRDGMTHGRNLHPPKKPGFGKS